MQGFTLLASSRPKAVPEASTNNDIENGILQNKFGQGVPKLLMGGLKIF